jgi:hypothetical protein
MLFNTIPTANSVILTDLIIDTDVAILKKTANKSDENLQYSGEIDPYSNRSILIQNHDSANSIWIEFYKDAVV